MARTAWLGIAVAIAATVATAQEPAAQRPDLEVVLRIDGGMPPPLHYFLLRVGFEGEVEGGGDLNPGLPAPPKRLSPAAHARIEALLDKERFFDRTYRTLACAPDLGSRGITAWRGTKRRGVSFCLEGPRVAVPEAQSVLRVWYGVLSIVAEGRRVPVAEADKRLLAKQR